MRDDARMRFALGYAIISAHEICIVRVDDIFARMK